VARRTKQAEGELTAMTLREMNLRVFRGASTALSLAPPRAPVPDPEGPSGSEGKSRGGKLNALYACPPMEFRIRAAEMLD